MKPTDQNEFAVKISKPKLLEAINQFEKLQDNLANRYTEQQMIYEQRRAKLFNNNSNNLNSSYPGTSVQIQTDDRSSHSAITNCHNVDDEDNDDNIYPIMGATDLIKFICSSSSQLHKVLIIDIRSAEEFEESSIAANKIHTKCDLQIINIPSNIIMPSMTFPKLLKSINLGVTFDALDRRRSMDRIVIMDMSTNHFDDDSNCVRLAMALNKVNIVRTDSNDNANNNCCIDYIKQMWQQVTYFISFVFFIYSSGINHLNVLKRSPISSKEVIWISYYHIRPMLPNQILL